MTTVTQDLSLIHLIAHASVLVQLVLGALLSLSAISWWYIFRKMFVIREAHRKTDSFERGFWSGADMGTLYHAAVNAHRTAGSMERVFEAGFREFVKLRKQAGIPLDVVIDGTRRAMRAPWRPLEIALQSAAVRQALRSV